MLSLTRVIACFRTVTAEELEAKEVRQRERRERRAAQIQEQEEDDGAGWEKVHKGAPMVSAASPGSYHMHHIENMMCSIRYTLE